MPERRECFFAHLSERPCDGPTEWAHLIPKSFIRRELGTAVDVWEEALWRPACRRHHGDFDNAVLRLPRGQLPKETVAWAKRWGLEWWLDRTYGPGAPTAATTSSRSSPSGSSGRS